MSEFLPLIERFGLLGAVVAGAIIGIKVRSLWKRETEITASEAFKGATAPFMAAVESMDKRFDRMESRIDEVMESVQSLEETRQAQVEHFARTTTLVEQAHAMAARALEKSAVAEGYLNRVAADLSVHVHKHPHGGPGYSEP